MRFEFEPSFGDQFRATIAVMLRGWMRLVAIVLPLIAIVLMLPVMFGRRSLEVSDVLVCAWCAGLIPAILALNIWLARRKNKTVVGVHTMMFDADGIHISGRMFATTIRWEAFTKVVETKSFFLFFIAARRANMLPKRAVPPEQLPALRQLIAACHGTLQSK